MSASKHPHLVIVKEQAAKKHIRLSQRPLNFGPLARNVAIAEHLDTHCLASFPSDLCSLRASSGIADGCVTLVTSSSNAQRMPKVLPSYRAAH